MKLRLTLPLLLAATSVAFADPHPGDAGSGGAKNKDGSVVTGVLTAKFDPTAGLEGVPIPNNLFYISGGTTKDLTVNISTAGLEPTVAALVNQLNSMDGFSTTERWTTSFINNLDEDNPLPGSIDPASVVAGQSVRVFEVTTSQFLFVTGVIRELAPEQEYTAVTSGGVVAIVPLVPLAEYSSFMAVLTNDIRDSDGNDATPDTFYYLAKADTPWVDENGKSTNPLLTDANAQQIEPLRQATFTMEAAAESVGIHEEDIILSWTVQTQSISRTLGEMRQLVEPAPVTVGPSIGDTSIIGSAAGGIADIHVGVITLPYYGGIPREENYFAALNEYWTAEPGGYLPPFDQFGLDPTSTNVTIANPLPVLTGMQTVPVLVTVPNAKSGMSKPPGGWPVVIFGHGITRSRMDMLGVADTLAGAGFVAVAIDFPLHGVEPWNPLFAGFYVGNTPFAPIANERTFDVDYINNETGAPGPDGIVDASGVHAINLQEFRAARDNVRQGVHDLSVLASSMQNFDLDQDGVGDLQPFNIGYVGQSWGGIHGGTFAALEPLVNRLFLSVPGGGILRFAEASPTFGPRIRAGLAAIGIVPGDPLYELYLTLGQTVADSADPINWISRSTAAKPIMLHEVIGDQVIPNFVLTAPLSGTEPLIRVGQFEAYRATVANPDGLRAAARFVPPADHGSLLSPVGSLAALIEMQGQMATFLGSDGTFIGVRNPGTMLPVAASFDLEIREPTAVFDGDDRRKPITREPVQAPIPNNNLD